MNKPYTSTESREALSAALACYCFKAHQLALRAGELSARSGHLQCTSVTLDTASLLSRLTDVVGDKMTLFSRNRRFAALCDLKCECEHFFASNKHLFEQGNEIFRECGKQEFTVPAAIDTAQFTLNNDLSNDAWLLDFGDLCDQVHDYITRTAEIADDMCKQLGVLNSELPASAQAWPVAE